MAGLTFAHTPAVHVGGQPASPIEPSHDVVQSAATGAATAAAVPEVARESTATKPTRATQVAAHALLERDRRALSFTRRDYGCRVCAAQQPWALTVGEIVGSLERGQVDEDELRATVTKAHRWR